jgi:hypothetical protein
MPGPVGGRGRKRRLGKVTGRNVQAAIGHMKLGGMSDAEVAEALADLEDLGLVEVHRDQNGGVRRVDLIGTVRVHHGRRDRP